MVAVRCLLLGGAVAPFPRGFLVMVRSVADPLLQLCLPCLLPAFHGQPWCSVRGSGSGGGCSGELPVRSACTAPHAGEVVVPALGVREQRACPQGGHRHVRAAAGAGAVAEAANPPDPWCSADWCEDSCAPLSPDVLVGRCVLLRLLLRVLVCMALCCCLVCCLLLRVWWCRLVSCRVLWRRRPSVLHCRGIGSGSRMLLVGWLWALLRRCALLGRRGVLCSGSRWVLSCWLVRWRWLWRLLRRGCSGE